MSFHFTQICAFIAYLFRFMGYYSCLLSPQRYKENGIGKGNGGKNDRNCGKYCVHNQKMIIFAQNFCNDD